ncbi:MAG: excinuclease ABC subunit UvrA [Burkholderiaceae bacterium]|nr:excinuclease ABC subunit UvrA [Burkholderiaceae bacterium]
MLHEPTPDRTDASDEPRHSAGRSAIRIRGARQNNLKNLDVDIPIGELVVVTGVSGSGKSSLVFDTLYAEGQRRYVETFSAYARQFLDRMDKPQVDRIEGVPPAIAIDQTNPVRTSRSTVGTMTELNDHLKLLFARAATLHCRGCGRPVRRDTVASVREAIVRRAAAAGDPRLVLGFPVPVPANFGEAEIRAHLDAQGYARVQAREVDGERIVLHVVQDRFRASGAEPSRLADSIEAAFRRGHGRLSLHVLDDDGSEHERWRYSTGLHCADCDIGYAEPLPSLFSFNSPIGACERCRGFGRVIGVDLGLVIPDEGRTLAEGAVKPWQTKSFADCQRDLVKFAARAGVRTDVSWRALGEAERRWVIEGAPDWTGKWETQWYGIRRFFEWLESRAYKMHIRVLLSKYRSYDTCRACGGARLVADALLWRVGDDAHGAGGRTIHELMLLPIDRLAAFFAQLRLPAPLDEATVLLLDEIRNRLRFLREVGLGYLTLDRQSRTLSGGEVQRINLTTALGTSLVNALFVLDEPSIGLHPRDMGRVIAVMQRLREAGNSLVVVEHDPLVMRAADRVLDIGPGPGERGGEIVFYGPPAALAAARTLTGDYLSGRRVVDAGRRLPVSESTKRLVLEGAREHNLKLDCVELPLERLVCLTGVSGSGKSTLMQNVLLPALLRAKGRPTETPGAHQRLLGDDWIGDVVFVDQSPIGKTARSNPASYVGAFDAIRKRFAGAPLSHERGYTAGTFSFNAGDGRCPTCSGNGFEHVEMQFLSDVYLRCPDCNGSRFRDEVLEVTIEGEDGIARSIAGVLDLTVREALAVFGRERDVRTKLQPLADVGLDYLRLGQPVPTLSGGEAQRLKLAGHLAAAAARGSTGRAARGTLFLFDEPTTGLHFDDVAKLLRALRKLLDAGHSLLVIEHNLDLIRAADWVVDLGPEGGDGGGELVAAGTPQDVMREPRSYTGAALREHEAQFDRDDAARDADGQRQAGLRLPAGGAPRVADVSLPARNMLRERARSSIFVHHAREHNLKNVDVTVPRDRFTVVTGVSGSGKSTLAFDVIFGEGQRRYLESLNAYARQFVQPAARPDVDGVYGIPPTVAIEQRASRGGRKSTVATLTEIHHFLRLLYTKLGEQYCPDCNVRIEPQSREAIAARIVRDYRGRHVGLLAPLIVKRKGVYTDLAKWAEARGFTHLRVDGAFLPTDRFPRIDRYVEHDIELPVAALHVDPAHEAALRDALEQALAHGKGLVMVAAPLDALHAASTAGDGDAWTAACSAIETRLFSTKRACASCGTSFPEPDPRLFSFNSKAGWCPSCLGTGIRLPYLPKILDTGRSEDDSTSQSVGDQAEALADQRIAETRSATDASPAEAAALARTEDEVEAELRCPDCEGQRLNRNALAVRLRGKSIAQLARLPVTDCAHWIDSLALDAREAEIGRDALAEIRSRLGFLAEVGLGYLALERSAPTLSGGEAQRIRLAAQLGSTLQGVCYVLDEPTIGLHPRDNDVLLDTLEALRDKGNTLLVVEHDEDTIRRADHVIDIGPGAGRLGGHIVASGPHETLASHPDSVTGRFLSHPLAHPLGTLRPTGPGAAGIEWLTLRNARLHNLAGIDVRIPLARMTVVTGVSGSGKSTLARDLLLRGVASLVHARNRREAAPRIAGVDAIENWQGVSRVLEVDQTPIGKTPRSCPATYVGFWDAIRRLFADTAEARLRGWGPGRFSFNTAGGRCPACEGQGMQTIAMSFLPDVKVSCDVCGGQRFNAETLEIALRDRSIGDVLAMNVDEALEFFAAHPSISHPLRLLQDVGLGYLTLGQPSPTLSGGEAQRIKLVTELAKVRISDAGDDPRLAAARERALARGRRLPPASNTLYVLDEPTVGLHMADVEKLIRVLHRLVDAGNTLVVVEHDVDVWAEADWIVDLGPEGGADGGRIVAAGTPRDLAAQADSHTARALARFEARRALQSRR